MQFGMSAFKSSDRNHRYSAEGQAAATSKPRRRSQHGPALITINRVRAGTTNHLNLPLFEEQSPCASLF